MKLERKAIVGDSLGNTRVSIIEPSPAIRAARLDLAFTLIFAFVHTAPVTLLCR
jgi:hypothetical protein